MENTELDNAGKEQAIKEFIDKSYVPAKKHSDEVKKLKDSINEKDQAFADYKASKMTEEEKVAETLKNNSLRASKLIAENVFAKAGFSSETYEEIVGQIAGEDVEMTEKLANAICAAMLKQNDTSKAELEKKYIDNTPKPTAGNAEKASTSENQKQDYEQKLAECQKNKDMIGVARYTRLIQELEINKKD